MSRLARVALGALVAAACFVLFHIDQELYWQAATTTSALICWAFVIRYAVKSPWRANVVGRALMYLIVSLAVVFTLICTSFVFGDYWFRPYVRFVVYTALPFALAGMLWVLVLVQRGRVRGEIPSHHVDGGL